MATSISQRTNLIRFFVFSPIRTMKSLEFAKRARSCRLMLSSWLESRAVLLDNDLVDFCRRLPHQFKIRNGKRKYLLKKAMQGVLPPEIIDRPKKGFGVPTARWLKSIPAQPPLAPIPGMRMDRVADAWAAHRAGAADNRLFLWTWLSLQSISYTTAPETPAAAA